jgi:hypothetical protein
MLLRLNSYSLHECFFEATLAFNKLGINNADELIDRYYNTKLSLNNLVEELYNIISTLNTELIEIWNIAKTDAELDSQVLKILEAKTWYNLLPFAVCSKSPEILGFIVDSISNSAGYEYILRIISENSFITNEIKQKLLNSKLAEKYKNKLVI